MTHHPLSFPGGRNGALGMKAGDRVRVQRGPLEGQCGIADEFLQDGDTYLTMDDGTFATVKWNHLEPAP
jgi:hypothetical protein